MGRPRSRSPSSSRLARLAGRTDLLVDVNAVPGLPTIYTVHLTAGRTVQLYLDPGTPGANEVHATFFDARATSYPCDGHDGDGSRGGPLAPLGAQLEPGHFVADTTLAAGYLQPVHLGAGARRRPARDQT